LRDYAEGDLLTIGKAAAVLSDGRRTISEGGRKTRNVHVYPSGRRAFFGLSLPSGQVQKLFEKNIAIGKRPFGKPSAAKWTYSKKVRNSFKFRTFFADIEKMFCRF
jgi:hypothetical protein